MLIRRISLGSLNILNNFVIALFPESKTYSKGNIETTSIIKVIVKTYLKAIFFNDRTIIYVSGSRYSYKKFRSISVKKKNSTTISNFA